MNALDHPFGSPDFEMGNNFTTSETKRLVTLPSVDKTAESPKGLGTGHNKPLMRNGKGMMAPAQGIEGNNFDGGVSATRSPQERKLDATYAAVDSLSLSLNYITHKQSCWQCSSNRDLCTDGYRLCFVAGAVEELKGGCVIFDSSAK